MASRGVKSKLKNKDVALAYRLFNNGVWSRLNCAMYLKCSKAHVASTFKRYEMNKRYDEIISRNYETSN